MLLDKHVSMFGLHHMGASVTVCILVGCLVVIVCFKKTGGATLHSFPYSNCMCFLPTLLYTSGVGETSVDACVAPHGLHWHSVYTGRLLRCNCLLVKYSSEMVQTATCNLFPYSNCMNFLQPSVQTSSIGATSLDVWVASHEFQLSQYACRLVRCSWNCLHEV